MRRLPAALPPIVALAATGLTLRFLVPARFPAGPVLPIGLFVLFALVAGYWGRQLGNGLDQRPVDLSIGRAAVATLIVAAAVYGIRTRLVDVARVTGASMAPTLNPGDRVLVNKVAFWAAPPQRGDLIVFPNPDHGRGGAEPASIVKRVIGLPGDDIAFVQGSPVINGWIVPSCDAGPFLVADGPRVVRGRLAVEVLADRTFLTVRAPFDDGSAPHFRVPPGELFVLGDDRAASRDSRAWNDGRGAGIAIARVEGRVSRLAAPVSGDGRLGLAGLLRGLRPELRVSDVDVTELGRRIATCVAHAPDRRRFARQFSIIME
ncbi:MAG TPA: signal peptidase I [Polyangia bacterium]|nr:signal peptidase I [Polyangia bacterium]